MDQPICKEHKQYEPCCICNQEQNEVFMQMSTAVLNNWDVRISLFDWTETLRVATYCVEDATSGRFKPIEVEYVPTHEAWT